MDKARKSVISWVLAIILAFGVLPGFGLTPGGITALADVPADEAQTTGFADSAASLGIRELARYSWGEHDPDGGIQEIVTYNPANKFSYSVNGKAGVLVAIDLNDLSAGGTTVASLYDVADDVDVKELVPGFEYGDMTSVAVSPEGTKLAVSIQAQDYDDPGCVAVFTCNADGSLTFDKAYPTGVQPDMVVFADNDTVLTADEGEARQGYTSPEAIDPMGSVTVIDLTVEEPSEASEIVDFTDYDDPGVRDALVSPGGIVLKAGTDPSEDLEPEYIAVLGGKAYVTLQEANAVAVLDLDNKEFTGIYSAGVQDFSKIAVDLDNTSEESDEGTYSPKYYKNTYGLRMPDGIAAYQAGGKTYLLTANEGDSREWGKKSSPYYYINEREIEDFEATDGTLAAKKVRFLTTDYEGQPGLSDGSNYYLFGGRSFSMFEVGADGLTLVYDSGSQFESKTAAYLPDYFNCSNDDAAKDSRSNKKGPEPETVTTGTIGGRTYAFITLERIGGVMVYDVTDPKKVSFVNYINSRDFEDVDGEGIGNDDSAEGLKFIPAASSPTGGNLLLAAFEVSGDTAAYALTPKTAAAKPLELAVISDDHLYDNDVLGTGSAMTAYLNSDRKMILESEKILDEAIRRILNSDAEYVLISGDLTKDGEKVNHELLASKLAVLEQYGKQVFVINGNHDLSNKDALYYIGDDTSPAATVDRALFKSIYDDFGYAQAVSQDPNSLSYTADLGDSYRLIVMDACEYNNLTDDGREQHTGGQFSEATLNWILGQIESSIRAGRRPVGMMHHGLVSHTAVEPVFFPEYLVDNYQTVSQRFADAGMNLVFTGHHHAQDATVTTTAAGKKLYDMQTGSLVTAPSPIRYVTINGSTVDYTSEPIDTVVGIEDVIGTDDFDNYKKSYLMTGLVGLVPGMLVMADPAHLTLTGAAMYAGQEITTGAGVTVGQFLAGCMADYYAGTVAPDTTNAAIISGLLDSSDPLVRTLGGAAFALAYDTTGNLRTDINILDTVADNDGSFTLSTLPVYSDDNDNGSGGGSKSGTAAPAVPAAPSGQSLAIPADFLSNPGAGGTVTLKSDLGNITVPANMLSSISGAGGKKAEIVIGAGDKSGLPSDVKAAIGDRPLISLSLLLDGAQTDWENPDAPVSVSIPYTPTAAELANPENIVIWYIDGSGNAVCVPNGHYDPVTKTVVVEVTHFSDYAVAYNKVAFKDVTAGAWYNKAVSFIAARDITAGTGGGNFSPDAQLTRGQFIVMLMRAYEIAPDKSTAGNFSDAGSTYYTGYLAAAKRLGISDGIGNNMFAPEKEITRQEMFTLLYNALEEIGKLPAGTTGKPLSSYGDAGQIASWAKDAMTLLVETGTVSGSNGMLAPAGTTSRAEMSQVLYNLLSE
jgi:3',5'-cyclic AMP phosphodiesterase CpdA